MNCCQCGHVVDVKEAKELLINTGENKAGTMNTQQRNKHLKKLTMCENCHVELFNKIKVLSSAELEILFTNLVKKAKGEI